MIGQVIGNYRILTKLGEGGMGAVYEAIHPVIGRRAAIKILRREVAMIDGVVSRFFAEARAVNEIRHPSIVEVTDFGELDGLPYLVMELLQGETLDARIRRDGPLPEVEAAAIAGQIAAALGAAHDKRIVHRDLKPENVFLVAHPDGVLTVKVLDFGIAKLTGDTLGASHRTRTGAMLGTPYYMSPEQVLGDPTLDHRSDVYALGVLLYETMTGTVPFQADTVGALALLHHTGELEPPSRRNAAISPAMEALIVRALARRPEDRFPSMSAVRAALAPLATGPSSRPARTGPAIREPARSTTLSASSAEVMSSAPSSKRRTPMIAAAGVAVAGVAMAGWLAIRDRTSGSGGSAASEDPPVERPSTAASTVNPVDAGAVTRADADITAVAPAQDAGAPVAEMVDAGRRSDVRGPGKRTGRGPRGRSGTSSAAPVPEEAFGVTPVPDPPDDRPPDEDYLRPVE